MSSSRLRWARPRTTRAGTRPTGTDPGPDAHSIGWPWSHCSTLASARLKPPPPHRALAGDPTTRLAAHVARQPEGNRDNALFWAACRATEAGVGDLEPLVAAGVSAGLTEREAASTVLSAQRAVLHPAVARVASAAAPPPSVPTR